FLQFRDFGRDEFEHLFRRTRVIKERFKNYVAYQPLVDRMLAMVFEKTSTRTRVSFEAGIYQLGGSSIVLNMGETQLGRGEPIEDVARVITRMVDIVMIRTFEHANIERFAAHSRVPVINGLTNDYHPCQVLADLYTFHEHRGAIAGKTVAWIGDGNNMCHTWIQAAPIFGFKLKIATPQGYGVDPARLAGVAPEHVEIAGSPRQAAEGADLVTTDVWTSMGFEAEADARTRAFSGFKVDAPMMALATRDALFMHCLPAHRGEEVAAAVVDGPQSVVWDEAENRLHVQKALMEYLLLGKIDN
ncbi:MAG TPA: ornithine carbamoyltransferase, partial [Usitatibacter sp.]|nr:ornithine carbamoyltransferase [Usitatibacter sp.]